jgi:twitching motility protein PilU
MSTPKLAALFRAAVAAQASDLFLIAYAPPRLRVQMRAAPIPGYPALTAAEVDGLARSLLTPAQSAAFDAQQEFTLAWDEAGVGRFRINLFRERGHVGMVARHIRDTVPPTETLGLPATVRELSLLPRGLVLIVGAAGSGKSTTLAALVRERARRRAGHILTVEDPIEYLHEHDQSTVVQREVGFDTQNFGEAMRNAMRQAPDVIVLGEIRDRESMEQALNYSETGQLCLSTMHAANAAQAIKRIINFFPEHRHAQVRLDLSMNLQAILSQRLLPPASDSEGPVLCTELMLRSAHIADLIEKGEVDELRVAIEKNAALGMHTFDQDLLRLVQSGRITLETALEHADSRTDLSLRLRVRSAHDPQAV